MLDSIFCERSNSHQISAHPSDSSAGMTRIQLLILIALASVIVALTLPPWLEDRKVSQADVDVEIIAVAIQKYFKHTGEYPQDLANLVADPGREGWRGPYLESIPETPWGGSYQMRGDSYKICIPSDHPRVPAKYKRGGVAEISRVYLEGEAGAKYWW
jgi:type II secretory pathway pseudopilin PulG